MLFLAGSALCGQSQSMTELIAFRAVQGLGAGGLIVLTQAVVGDIVSPRERGKYQGIFGARVRARRASPGRCSAGSSSSTWSWRWIFYVNLPIGLLALVVIAITLSSDAARRPAGDRLPRRRTARGRAERDRARHEPRRDDVGVGVDGDVRHRRDRPRRAGAVRGRRAPRGRAGPAARAVAPAGVPRGRRALVRSSGFALFGAVTFLPLYFQTVDADTPTESGLRLVPMMVGVLITSIASGQAISRIGRYKAFPIAGTRGDGDRHVPAVAPRGRDEHRGRVALPVRARPRHGPGDAGARARGAEQRCPTRCSARRRRA